MIKEQIKKRVGALTPDHKEWYRHLGHCIEYEMCPCCGEEITLREERRPDTAQTVFYFECACCRWRNA